MLYYTRQNIHRQPYCPKKLQIFFPVQAMLWFLLYSFWKQRRITRISGTYSITESITVSRNCLLLSERVCQDPVLALVSFTFFEEPFSPVNTKAKRKLYDLSNLDRQLCDSIQSDHRQRYNSSDFSMSQNYQVKSIHIICKSQVA